MFTTVGRAVSDIATGWAASLGLSVPTYVKGQEILVEKVGNDYRPIPLPTFNGQPYEVLIPAHLLNFDLP